ncbi:MULTISPECIES: flagellin N-terminal helical domain-containing protein [Citrobacter]|uniref:flagellin N-terminal helical domain-containing protein n=1 Tax=Citrobacter TaxID=544 RepID=UPI00050556D2|nr:MULTISPECIES: flagellin [Citrobacter]TKU75825.1 flagellin FliC [Citrobacter sp. wls706]UCA26597.1 flagellin FliC [Citrobacter werkmanii]GAL43610.1 flagellin [Citrobacter werkmanii NBRC 105721]
MAQVINTNSLSLLTQNNLNKSQSTLSSAIERLSSGLRINSAKDDAAGQAIANRFTANIKGLTQASRNANDGISIAQTTEGALNEINNNLQRVRELSVQATNGSNSDSDLTSIQNEITQRLSEIDRVSGQTQFNGVKVLAQDNTLKIQVGANDGETISIDLKKIDSKTLGMDGFNVNGSKAATGSDLVSKFDATGYDAYTVGGKEFRVDLKTGAVSGDDGAGGFEAKFVDAKTGALVKDATKTNGTAKYSTTATAAADADAVAIATAAKDLKVGQTFNAAGIDFTVSGSDVGADGHGTFTANIGGSVVTFTTAGADLANSTLKSSESVYTSSVSGKLTTKSAETNLAATVDDLKSAGTKTGSALTIDGKVYDVSADGSKVTNGGVTMFLSQNQAGKATLVTESVAKKATANPLETIDKALAQVDALRSDLGAVQNRFDSTITNLGNTVNNLSSARSRIEDADYATEVSNMSKAQILQQAGTSVLAQANQVPQNVLSLLR